MPNNTSLIGQNFGRLTVVAYAYTKNQKRYWCCICSCGSKREVLVSTGSLRTGNTQSCGCLNKEVIQHKNRKHTREESSYLSLYCTHTHKCHNDKYGYLDYKTWKSIVSQPCAGCGKSPLLKKSKCGDYVAVNGIDRIDSKIGYISGNIQPFCKWCNIAKSDKSMEEFIINCTRVAQFHKTIPTTSTQEVKDNEDAK